MVMRGLKTVMYGYSKAFSGEVGMLATVEKEYTVSQPLPPNLTMLGPRESVKSRLALNGNTELRRIEYKKRALNLKDSSSRSKNSMKLYRKAEKKQNFIMRTQLAAAERLNKYGKPLLKNVLRDSLTIGDLSEAVVECEDRLARGEDVDNRLVTTMIRTFGSAGELDKAIDCEFSVILYVLIPCLL